MVASEHLNGSDGAQEVECIQRNQIINIRIVKKFAVLLYGEISCNIPNVTNNIRKNRSIMPKQNNNFMIKW